MSDPRWGNPFPPKPAWTSAASPEAPSTQDARASGSAAPVPSLPTGGGAFRGIGETFSANPATGTASLQIPLVTITKGPDFWVVQLQGREPDAGVLYSCVETGGVFRLEFAGNLNHRAEMAGKRIVRLYSVSGNGQVEEGWHLVGGTG